MSDVIIDVDDGENMTEPRSWVGLTVLDGLFLLIAVLAAVLRLSDLAGLPLSPAEAEEALRVWRFGQPDPGTIPTYPFSPLYFTLTVPLAAILGDSDAVMRLAPALAGTIFVLLPWLWRHWLGGSGALAASLLLTVSPVTVALARTAGGDALALVALFLLLLAGVRYVAGGRRVWAYVASGALGAGLATAPLFFSGLATLALGWFVQSRLGPPWFAGASPNGQENGGWRRPAAFGGAVFLLGSSFFFLNPAGLGEAAAIAGRWLGQFMVPGSLRLFLSPLLTLGRYELAAVTLGAAAIIWATWQGRPVLIFLVYWFAAALLLALFQPAAMSNVALMTLPSYLLVGFMVGELFRQRSDRLSWAVWMLFVVLGAIFYFNLARYARTMTYNSDDYSYALMAVIALGILLVSINFVRSLDATAAIQGTIAGVTTLLLIFNWGTAWWLTHEAANDPRTSWVTVGADDDVRLLTDVIEEISWERTGAGKDVELLVTFESPLLRWNLRGFENLQTGHTMPPMAQQPVIVTMTGEQEPGPNYIGSDFNLRRWEATAPGSTMLDAALRWWLFRETSEPLQTEKVILWTRPPLAAAGN